MNQINNFNNQDYLNNMGQEGTLNLSDNQDMQNINIQNEEMDYGTDSDIDDPKYMPSGNMIQNQDNFENIQNFENIDNFGAPSENQMFLQTQIMNLENDTMMVNKTLQQLENENDQLKDQLIKNQKKVQTKEGMNNEYKQILAAFKQRFEQYEKRNNSLQQYINQLEERLKKLDIELIE